MVDVHVQHGQKRIRIALLAIRLDRRPNVRLRQNQFRQLMEIELFSIPPKELPKQTLDSLVVDIGVR